MHAEPFRGPGVTDAAWSIPGCEDVTLPFWDETADPARPIPTIFTSPRFELDGEHTNPLYSYTLGEALVENTQVHNESYPDADANTAILGKNVSVWLAGTVRITPDGDDETRCPDTYSVLARYKLCLEAPNYTVFLNTTSQTQHSKNKDVDDLQYVVSLESPYNAIHLAVGGFYQKGIYNADPIIGANGDMGDNETASFDPIFYFHHCFVDYAFWKWQQFHDKTAPRSLDVIDGYPGTIIPEGEGLPYLAPGTKPDMNTPLYPFRGHLHEIKGQIDTFKRVKNVNRANYSGSFVIRTFAEDYKGNKIEIGCEAILSRRNVAGCANCQNKLNVESIIPSTRGSRHQTGSTKVFERPSRNNKCLLPISSTGFPPLSGEKTVSLNE
ncbi:putative tyrosinase [Xylaria acuta]|nr:putative tyrosinase [Xylaria acuta]